MQNFVLSRRQKPARRRQNDRTGSFRVVFYRAQ